MEMAVEHNHHTRRFMNFLCRLFYKIYIKTSQIWNKTNVKIKCKYKRLIISYFCRSSKYERSGSQAKLTTYFPQYPLRSYFDEQQKNQIRYLNKWKFSSKPDSRLYSCLGCAALEWNNSYFSLSRLCFLLLF